MDNQLFEQIEKFNFDHPIAEYGFSTRLAYENYWTLDFTQKAIAEYKKFMYLATTSSQMVSPSEVVDIVWHQHLIYSQSYEDFCKILGRKILHVPSTHNRAEKDKFIEAVERTKYLYERNFGKQPPEFWQHQKITDSLQLPQTILSETPTIIVFGILLSIIFYYPIYLLFSPIYQQINNPYFLFGYIGLITIVLLSLKQYNQIASKSWIEKLKQNGIIQNLHPYELIFLKSNKIEKVVHGMVNQLVIKNILEMQSDFSLTIAQNTKSEDVFEHTILETVQSEDKIFYPTLLRRLLSKPLLLQIGRSVKHLKDYLSNTKQVAEVKVINTVILFLILVLGVVRLDLGLARNKPVTFLIIVLIIFAIIILVRVSNVSKIFVEKAIPKIFEEDVLPQMDEKQKGWQWRYYLNDTLVYAANFNLLVGYFGRNSNSNAGTSCGSSCGSSCGGSSCGSSCGGCGGGGD